MEASPAPPGGARHTRSFLLVLTADQREICYPKPGLAVEGLSLRMLSLGAGARDEEHVLEAEGAKVIGQTVSQTTAKLTLQPSLPTLGLGINLTPPVTFRLKTGPGPLFISVQHTVAEESTSAAVAMVTAKEVSGPPVSQCQEKANLQIIKSLKKWKKLHEKYGISTLGVVGQDTQSLNAKKLCPGQGVSSPAEAQVASTAVKDSAQGTPAKEPGQGPNICNNGQEKAKETFANRQIVNSVKKQCMMHGIATPGVGQVTQSLNSKKMCPGLGISSSVEAQVTSAVKDTAQGSQAKVPNVCHTAVKNGTLDTGAEHVPQAASVSKPVEPNLQKGTAMLPSTKKSKKKEKAPLTAEEIKNKVQNLLTRGCKIPLQIFKFGKYLKDHYQYETQDYAHLVELWNWRLSIYKTYG